MQSVFVSVGVAIEGAQHTSIPWVMHVWFFLSTVEGEGGDCANCFHSMKTGWWMEKYLCRRVMAMTEVSLLLNVNHRNWSCAFAGLLSIQCHGVMEKYWKGRIHKFFFQSMPSNTEHLYIIFFSCQLATIWNKPPQLHKKHSKHKQHYICW